MEKRVTWFTVALIVLLPLIFIPFGRGTVGAFPQVQSMGLEPVKAPDTLAWDVLQADSALQFFGWRDLVLESWSKGRVPGWNQHQFGGAPLLANSQSGALYPPHMILGIAQVPTGLAINFLAWLHLVGAGLGAWMLAKAIGSNLTGAALAGICFELSPFLLGWTPLPSVISVSAWIPWALVGIVNLSSARPYRAWLMTTVSVAMMILAGHLQFAAYGCMAVAVCSITISIVEFRRKSDRPFLRSAVLVPTFVAAAALSCLHLMPVLAGNANGHRQATATAEGYAGYQSTAIPAALLVTTLAPGLTGWPGAYALPAEDGELGPASYWPALTRRGMNFAESALGIGAVAFAALFAFRRRTPLEPGSVGLISVGVFGLLLAVGTPLGALLYFGLPGWAATGSPGRAAVLLVLAACVLAGRAFREVEVKADLKRPTIALAVGVILSLILPVTLLGKTPSWLSPEISVQPLVSAAMLSTAPYLLVSALAAAVCLWLATQPARHVWIPAVVAVGQLAVMFGFRMPHGYPPIKIDTPNERFAYVNRDWSMMERAPAFMPPNLATLYGHRDIAGYDSLIDRGTVDMLREINGGKDPAPMANGNMLLVKPEFDLVALREAGVAWAYTSADDPPIEVDGELISSQGTVEDLSYESGHISFRTTGAGEVIVRERNLSGWELTVNDQSTPIRQGRWISFDTTESESSVRLSYDPWNGRGTVLGIITGLSAIGLAFPLFWRRTKSGSTVTKSVE